jgi:pyruvate,water dikinase
VFRVPTALGIEHRILNGYVYLSPNVITDEAEVARRAEDFHPRAGYYFEHWTELYDSWVKKATDCTTRLREIEFEPLPDIEPLETVTAGQALTSGHRLLASYTDLLENAHEMAYYHFEMLGLGYGAYLTFRDFCKQAFPNIEDQTIAKMVAGLDILMFRPDDELRKLARRAVELDVARAFTTGANATAVLAALREAPRGDEWIKELENAREPWFWFSTGTGLVHTDRAWNDDLSFPVAVIADYVEKLEAGEKLERPLETVQAEGNRITREYRGLLASQDRKVFDELVELARTVYPFVENHNFYCEHQHYSVFWNKARKLGSVFAARGFLADAEDLFLLHRYEIYQAIWDLETGWATETPDRGAYWRHEVAERKRILEALRKWSPPPALGQVPETITEPFTVMLWGITSETVDRWLGSSQNGAPAKELRGIAAAPGMAEGPARVIHSADQLQEVKNGEVLVCPITAPSWAPVFTRIAAAVSDIGGIMAHAAIVSREYALPAVVGTGFGTKTIENGQMLRVDGDNGIVTVLD